MAPLLHRAAIMKAGKISYDTCAARFGPMHPWLRGGVRSTDYRTVFLRFPGGRPYICLLALVEMHVSYHHNPWKGVSPQRVTTAAVISRLISTPFHFRQV